MSARRTSVWVIAASALVALAAWPSFVTQSSDRAHAATLPTMAPVEADYKFRDAQVAFWERVVARNQPGDMLSPRNLAGQYLQRYRERGDLGDVLRAEAAARRSLRADLINNPGADDALASALLTLHRFREARRYVHDAERWQRGNAALLAKEASLDMELGEYAGAERILAGIAPSRFEDAPVDTVRSRYLEVTGHLSEARQTLERAAANVDSVIDAPAVSRAWYHFREGELAFAAGDDEGALAQEQTAIGMMPTYQPALNALARFYWAMQRWPETLAAAKRAAAVVPFPETLGYEEDAQRALGDAAGAAQTADLILAIERIGNANRVSDRLLAIYFSEHRLRTGDAYRIAKRELALRDDIYAEDTLAWAAASDSRWSEARAHAAKALRFDTEDSRLQYHAGVVALHFGDRVQAKRRFERALALNSHFHPVYADDARRQLANL